MSVERIGDGEEAPLLLAHATCGVYDCQRRGCRILALADTSHIRALYLRRIVGSYQ